MPSVRQWLDSLGLGQYADAFDENAIQLEILGELDHGVLKEMGVTVVGHRLRILKAIRLLDHEQPPPAARSGHERVSTRHPTSRSEAERRQLTVMFCDLVGSVELGERMEVEDYRDLLAHFRDAAVTAVECFDGFVARHQGDGLLVYFGYPQAHENDAARAVKAGLALVRAVETLDHPFRETPRVRVGIATGPTVIGDLLDTGGASEFAALGGTPNLAARLQGEARPNSVLVSATTKRLVEGEFEFEPTGALDLKGFAEPVVAYRALSESESPAHGHDVGLGALSSLVGREVELALLLDRWSKAKQGSGQAVLLSAEPGVGKSRLVRELRGRLEGVSPSQIELYCSPYHAGSTLHPVVDAIQRTLAARRGRTDEPGTAGLIAWIDELGLDAAWITPLIAPLLSLPVPEDMTIAALAGDELRRRTLGAIAAIIDAHVARAPVLLIAEDLHWADATTLELLDRIIVEGRDRALFAVLTCRPEFVSPWSTQSHVTTLALNHLTREESRAFVAQLRKSLTLSETAMDQIIERTDGIPLFVEELARSVAGTGDPAAAIPETLRDALTARLDQLGPAKKVAQLASVIGRNFSLSLLAALFDGTGAQLERAIDALLASDLARRHRTSTGDDYEFKHSLVCDTAYESLLRRRRRALHARLMTHLEGASEEHAEPPLELLAHHAHAAEDWNKAFSYARRAGHRAALRGANAETLAHYEVALEAASHLTPSDALTRDLIAVRVEMRSPLHALGHNERLEDELKIALAAAEGLGERHDETILRTYLSNLYRHRGMVEEALGAAEQAHSVALELENRSLVICSTFDLAQAERAVGRLRRCIESSTRGLTLIEHDEAGAGFGRPAPASVLLRFLRAEALADLGEFETARAEACEVVALADSLGHQFGRVAARWGLTTTDYWRGELASTVESLEAMVDIVRRERLRLWLLYPGWMLSDLYARQGRGEDALVLCQEAIEINRALGYDLYTGRLVTAHGFALHALGRQDEAEHRVRSGLRLARGRDATGEAWCGWIAGQVLDDRDEARKETERALGLAARLEMRPLAALCDVQIARQNEGDAAESAIARLRTLGMTGWAELLG